MTEAILQPSTSSPLADESALQTLLDTLSINLPSNLQQLLNDDSVKTEMVSFLSEICTLEDTTTYLSPRLSQSDSNQSSHSSTRTLIQDIAELEAQSRVIDDQLKSLIVNSQDLILKNREDVDFAVESFKNEFIPEFRNLWGLLNDEEQEQEQEQQDQNVDANDNFDELVQAITGEFATENTAGNSHINVKPSNNDTFQERLRQLKSATIELTTSTSSSTKPHLTSILQSMDQLQDLLSLPSLTTQCIKTGHYSEALELHSYVRRLSIRFQDMPLIQDIEQKVTSEISTMLESLLRLLRSNMRQSSVVKTISYLRRIPPFANMDSVQSEQMLRRCYLHARFEFIRSELESLEPLRGSEGNEERYLKRCVEVIREFGFQGCVIYRNLFQDEELRAFEVGLKSFEKKLAEKEEEPQSNEDPESAIDQSPKETSTETFVNKDDKLSTDTLLFPSTPTSIQLYNFLKHTITLLCEIFQEIYPKLSTSQSKDSIILQLIYCSQSLGRIDGNFGNLFTCLMLNLEQGEDKEQVRGLIDREVWVRGVEKQRSLTMSLDMEKEEEITK
ncbi:hypothetical protein WICPIJ_001025 [Wickerhamomyces pijperi]|uniref:Conserved oligomeric Golgi complex subunit 8 n=1 Tax=Wickerhamomyces pijperi TaxID=599730 RepID=A0A9P8TQA8_WICPI|nr:hypothetical protein WICPIJ_001025 [Wickerhamomyces pijperi]